MVAKEDIETGGEIFLAHAAGGEGLGYDGGGLAQMREKLPPCAFDRGGRPARHFLPQKLGEFLPGKLRRRRVWAGEIGKVPRGAWRKSPPPYSRPQIPMPTPPAFRLVSIFR